MKGLQVKKYKKFQIHVVRNVYKYDVYDSELRWCTSVNTLEAAKKTINMILFMRDEIPE